MGDGFGGHYDFEPLDEAESDSSGEVSNELMNPAELFNFAVAGSIKELYERVITLENVLADVIVIIRDSAEQPHSMAEKLGTLLVPIETPQDNSKEG